MLTEKNDSTNMGTYNYASPKVFFGIEHLMYDVMPWKKWNNIPDEPAHGASKKGNVKKDNVESKRQIDVFAALSQSKQQ